MLERVRTECRAALPGDAAARVTDAVAAALAHRHTIIADTADPRLLLPARTVRILLADTACRDADALAAAPAIDSVDPHLAPPVGRLDPAARRVLKALPTAAPDAGGLLEQLVCADLEIATIALAERLDQARHLHLRPELPWAPFHHEVRTAWAPAAHRIAPGLARRLDRWADAFERRVLLSG